MNVMNQLVGMVPETNISLLSRMHFYLLLVSLGAVAVAAFYLVGIDKIQLLFSTYPIFASAWIHTGTQLFAPVINSFSHIPALVILIGAILAVLLILERILLRKTGQSAVVFLY